jgi:hypothetical protein
MIPYLPQLRRELFQKVHTLLNPSLLLLAGLQNAKGNIHSADPSTLKYQKEQYTSIQKILNLE